MEYDLYRTGLSWDYCSMILFSNTSYLHHLRGLTFRPVKLATKVFTIFGEGVYKYLLLVKITC